MALDRDALLQLERRVLKRRLREAEANPRVNGGSKPIFLHDTARNEYRRVRLVRHRDRDIDCIEVVTASVVHHFVRNVENIPVLQRLVGLEMDCEAIKHEE